MRRTRKPIQASTSSGWLCDNTLDMGALKFAGEDNNSHSPSPLCARRYVSFAPTQNYIVIGPGGHVQAFELILWDLFGSRLYHVYLMSLQGTSADSKASTSQGRNITACITLYSTVK